ncbi:hypothetical protein ABWK96_004521 [Vibrio parahaemolyticus]|uniref:hypothetical protein n=1 Tax=Vibrio parahaemolyticus TaxID=670 RepID=UPI0005B7156C|nr:hypothetical protein [Vibrio parahaemolyticus]KIT53118.1 hypothetical protein H334_23875 [Vibrio parahaemolyticus 901128]EGQ8033631.1 hypothetical protein [Vibrio parahaemolyticus]EGQ8261616.1 hypothetical protein [Vibrio parahaemolyticus]EGQ8799011.1 hypothetical protein [Vibrio parahaemolyticus]EGQ8843291.1 hypothetical protein [Vibrio parahaemolyticus]
MYSSILILLYALLVSLGAVAGTCTQGDDGHFYASIMYGSVLFILIIVKLLRRNRDSKFIWITPLIALLAAMSVTYFWAPFVIETTIEGHHLCGKEFDSHLGEFDVWSRSIPTLHIVFSLAIFMLSFWKLIRCKAGK